MANGTYWKIIIRGKTLKQTLDEEVKKNSYLRSQDGDENFIGGKKQILRNIINTYKREAYVQMLEEYPEVKEAVKNAIKKKYSFRKKMSVSELKKEPKELLPRD